MSSENVEIVRRAYEAEDKRDFASLYALYHPDIEMQFQDSPFADLVDPMTRGLGEVQAACRDFYAAFENVESEVHKLIDARDRVVSVFTFRGTGRTSGVTAELKEMDGVWTVREGRIKHVTWLPNRAEAL